MIKMYIPENTIKRKNGNVVKANQIKLHSNDLKFLTIELYRIPFCLWISSPLLCSDFCNVLLSSNSWSLLLLSSQLIKGPAWAASFTSVWHFNTATSYCYRFAIINKGVVFVCENWFNLGFHTKKFLLLYKRNWFLRIL